MAGLRPLKRKSPTPSDFASLPILSGNRRKAEAEWVAGTKGVETGSISECLENPRKESCIGPIRDTAWDHMLVKSAPLHKSFSSTGTQQSVSGKEAMSKPMSSLRLQALLGLCLLLERICHLDLSNHPPFLLSCPLLPGQAASPIGGLPDC